MIPSLSREMFNLIEMKKFYKCPCGLVHRLLDINNPRNHHINVLVSLRPHSEGMRKVLFSQVSVC